MMKKRNYVGHDIWKQVISNSQRLRPIDMRTMEQRRRGEFQGGDATSVCMCVRKREREESLPLREIASKAKRTGGQATASTLLHSRDGRVSMMNERSC